MCHTTKWGGGDVKFPGKKHYEGVWFNVALQYKVVKFPEKNLLQRCMVQRYYRYEVFGGCQISRKKIT